MRSKKSKVGRKAGKLLLQIALAFFLILNILSFGGAYVLTNSSSGFGLSRPDSSKLPTDVGLAYNTRRIPINQTEWLETWFIPAQNSKGTVLLFPGHRGSKALQLLAPAQSFNNLGYDTLLVDFRGVGGSSGHTTTIGVREAKDVSLAVNYSQRSNLKKPYILYGVSMGSAAILKAMAEAKIYPNAIILELPFAELLNAIRSRLKVIGMPTFPVAELVVFWGSVQHGFNGFSHNPVTYARQVTCPTLILQGSLDQWTTADEINQIFSNLRGSKQLVVFPNAGHQLLGDS
jgi:uncharacterized protein